MASAAAFYASFGTPAPSAVGGSESAPAETFQTSKQVGFSTSYGPEGTYSTSSTVPAETSPTGIQTGSTETQSASTTAIESANPTNTSSPQKEEVAAGVFYDNLGLNPTGFSGKPYNQPYPHQFAGTATAPYPFPGTGSAGLPYTPSYAVGTAGLKSPYSGEAYNHELESGNHASAAAAASRSFAALYPNDHLGNGHRNGVAPTATAAAAKDVKDVVAGVGPYQAGGTGGVVTGVGPYHAVETGGGGAYRQAVGTGGLAEDTYRGVVGTSGAVYHHHLGEATGTGGLAAAAAETGGYYHQVGHEKRNLFPRDEEAVDLEDSEEFPPSHPVFLGRLPGQC